MNDFFCFMASSAGRTVRALAGIALIVTGVLLVGGTVGWIMAAVGCLPLAAGLFDFCIFAPLAQLPMTGSKLRMTLGCRV